MSAGDQIPELQSTDGADEHTALLGSQRSSNSNANATGNTTAQQSTDQVPEEQSSASRKKLDKQKTTFTRISDAAVEGANSSVSTIKWVLDEIGAISVILLVVAIGVVVLVLIAGWGFVEALYVITQVFTTIGYGDFTVSTNALRLFMVFYCLVAVVLLAYMINLYVNTMVEKQADLIRVHLRSLEVYHDDEVDNEEQAKKKYGATNKFIATGLLFIICVIFGTVFYRLLEHCSCPSGLQAVKGCNDDTYETCVATGGYTKSTVEAFYMSVITLTTIGFGDYQPRSTVGRVIGVIWMIVGVGTTACCLAALSEIMFSEPQKEKLKACEVAADIDEHVFSKIDKDHDGKVTQGEFLAYALLKYGAVDEALVDDLIKIFQRLDRNSDGDLTMSEIKRCGSSKRLD